MTRIAIALLLPFAAAAGLLLFTTGDPAPAVMLFATAGAAIAMVAIIREALLV